MDSIVHHEVSAVLNQLKALLSTCISLFYSPCTKYSLWYCSTGSNVNAISGSVVFHEDTLCSMEMLVKSTKISPVVKSTFREDKQWKLQQIQDAINHLKQAHNTLEVFSKAIPKDYSPQYIITVLDKVLRSIMLCRMRLFSPCKLSLQALVASGIVKMFSPPLPGDTIVNLFILEDSLVLTHYTVQQTHSLISKNSQSSNIPLLFHPVGSILEHSGSRYEIVTAHRAECQIPWLSKIMNATEFSLQLTNELKKKLNYVEKTENIFSNAP